MKKLGFLLVVVFSLLARQACADADFDKPLMAAFSIEFVKNAFTLSDDKADREDKMAYVSHYFLAKKMVPKYHAYVDKVIFKGIDNPVDYFIKALGDKDKGVSISLLPLERYDVHIHFDVHYHLHNAPEAEKTRSFNLHLKIQLLPLKRDSLGANIYYLKAE